MATIAQKTELETIAWQPWTGGKYARPGNWSKSHYTTDGGQTTLCGRDVPDDAADYYGEDYGADCKRCQRAAGE